MPEGGMRDLLVAASATALFGIWFLRRAFPAGWATAIVALKVAIPFAYFAWLFDGRQVLLDDLTYLRAGQRLLAAGETPWTLLFEARGRALLGVVAGGRHPGYAWWNTLAQSCFGAHYFAPVFLNVGASFLAGAWVVRLARRDFSARYAAALGGVFLLHWDLLAWSSLLNVKDVLVLTLTVGQLALCAELAAKVTFRRVVALALACAALFALRYYALVFTAAAGAAWMMLRTHDRRLRALGLVFAVVGVVIVAGAEADLRHIETAGVAHGAVRFLLTPQPWNVDARYAFLEWPALLHWFFAVPAVLGSVSLWRRSVGARLVLLHALAACAFYALVPELQGPRHRLQVALAVVWLQFHSVHFLLRAVVSPDRDGRSPAMEPSR